MKLTPLQFCCVDHGQKVISKVDPTGLVVTAWKSLGWAKA
jgi:hypothetical protein